MIGSAWKSRIGSAGVVTEEVGVDPPDVGVAGVAGKPRLLVIDRDSTQGKTSLDCLSDAFEMVVARTISKALSLLRDQKFAAVYVDASQLSAVRWVGMMIQAEEILDAISDGVAVVDPDLRIIWANPEFSSLTDPSVQPVGSPFYQALGQAEILGPDPCPFTTAVASQGAGEHGDEDRRQPLPAGHRHAGLRRGEHADAPDRPDPRDDRRDTAAAQGQRHPQGGRRAGRPDPGRAGADGGRGADRPAQVQHRPAHEGPAGAGLHRDPPAGPCDQAAGPALDRGHDAAGGQPRAVTRARRATA